MPPPICEVSAASHQEKDRQGGNRSIVQGRPRLRSRCLTEQETPRTAYAIGPEMIHTSATMVTKFTEPSFSSLTRYNIIMQSVEAATMSSFTAGDRVSTA
jgi:hypothetical protein